MQVNKKVVLLAILLKTNADLQLTAIQPLYINPALQVRDQFSLKLLILHFFKFSGTRWVSQLKIWTFFLQTQQKLTLHVSLSFSEHPFSHIKISLDCNSSQTFICLQNTEELKIRPAIYNEYFSSKDLSFTIQWYYKLFPGN